MPLSFTASIILTSAPFSMPRALVPSTIAPVTVPTILSSKPFTLSAEIVPLTPTVPSSSNTRADNLAISSGVIKREASLSASTMLEVITSSPFL